MKKVMRPNRTKGTMKAHFQKNLRSKTKKLLEEVLESREKWDTSFEPIIYLDSIVGIVLLLATSPSMTLLSTM